MNKGRWFVVIVFVAIVILTAILLFPTISFTGFFLQEESSQIVVENIHEQSINLDFNESVIFDFIPEHNGKFISFSVSGRVEGEGNVKIYLSKR